MKRNSGGSKGNMPKTGSSHYGGMGSGTKAKGGGKGQIYGASGGGNITANRYPQMSYTKGHGKMSGHKGGGYGGGGYGGKKK